MRSFVASKFSVRALAILCALSAGFQPEVTTAQESAEMPIEIEAPEDPIQVLLSKQKGKKVTVVLESGTELGGTIGDVTFDTVQIKELTGKEVFDATVRIDQIDAVLQRREAAPAK